MKWLSMIGEWQRRGLNYVATGLTLLGGLFSIPGCGSNAGNPTAESGTAEKEPPAAAPAEHSQPTSIHSASESRESSLVPTRPNSARETEPSSAEFGAAWLDQQIRQAAALRSAGKYTEETAHWDTVIKKLESSIGQGNWLVAGARLSRQVSQRLTQLDQAQLVQWKTFETLEMKFLENRGEIQELLALGKISLEQYRNATLEQLDILKQQATIVDKLFGQPSHLYANVAYHQAEVLASVQQWQPAFIAAERCLVQRQALIQVRHPDTVAALKLMGQIAQQMNDLKLAEDCLVKAVQHSEQVWGANNAAYAAQVNDLGVFYYTVENQKPSGQSKNFSKANHWLERGLRIRQQVFGADHLLVATSCRNYALSKMAEAAEKPADHQALDLAVANTQIERALQGIRSTLQEPSELLLQVLSEAATIKMLIHEYSEADDCLSEIVSVWQKDPQTTRLPISLATLHYRWGLACAKQRSVPKLEQATKLMEQAIRIGQGSDLEAKTVASARQALSRLNEIASGDTIDVIAGREPRAEQSLPNLVAEQTEATPVRIVSLPNVD